MLLPLFLDISMVWYGICIRIRLSVQSQHKVGGILYRVKSFQ